MLTIVEEMALDVGYVELKEARDVEFCRLLLSDGEEDRLPTMKAEEVPLLMSEANFSASACADVLEAVDDKLELLVTFSAAFLETPFTVPVEGAVVTDSKAL